MLKLLNWVRQQTTMLCYQASRGKQPALYADLFLDNVPEGITVETLAEQLQGEGAIEKLAAINGDVLKHRAWFEQFRDEVLARLADYQNTGDEPPVAEGGGAIEVNIPGEE